MAFVEAVEPEVKDIRRIGESFSTHDEEWEVAE